MIHIRIGQTTQWSKEKVQKDKQRSTKHTYKTQDRVTRTPLKTGGELDSDCPFGIFKLFLYMVLVRVSEHVRIMTTVKEKNKSISNI
jgi:hypothetical protein